MAEILPFNKPSTITVDEGEIWPIPEVYRLTGFEFDLARGDNVSFPFASNRPAPVEYRLHDQPVGIEKVAQPKWKQITTLDPDIDRGCLVVRHHANSERGYAYALREVDALLSGDIPTSSMVSNAFGIFTLTHYTKLRKGTPGHLIIYLRTQPGIDGDDLIDSDVSGCQYLIYHPNGKTSRDPRILYPGFTK